MRIKKGYTLIEALITMAIIGLLLGLLVPLVDRNLGKNRLANDAELLRSKVEEVRLLAGSTQLQDESGESVHPTFDEAGYYALFVHSDAYDSDHYDIVRLSYPVDATAPEVPCKPNDVQSQALNQSGPCFVGRIDMSRGVEFSCKMCGATPEFRSNHFLAFRVPTRQFHHVYVSDEQWTEGEPVFTNPAFELTFSGKTARVSIEPYTAMVKVEY